MTLDGEEWIEDIGEGKKEEEEERKKELRSSRERLSARAAAFESK